MTPNQPVSGRNHGRAKMLVAGHPPHLRMAELPAAQPPPRLLRRPVLLPSQAGRRLPRLLTIYIQLEMALSLAMLNGAALATRCNFPMTSDCISCDANSPRSRTHSDDGPDDTGDGRPDADEDSHDSVEDFDDSDRSSHDEFAEWEWLEQIDGVASVELEHSQVAYCNAKLIRRAHMRSAFWVEMEEPSQETSDLAFELFDRYGRLNREYCDHEIRKGSGAWGRELDHGDILLFESISVERLWRHRGIGTKMVNAILDKVRAKSSSFFAFARPGYFSRDVNDRDEEGDSETQRTNSRSPDTFGNR